MTRPTLTVEIALSTRPTETPTWVDVTDRVRGVLDITRGRTNELDRFEAGTCSLALDNGDRQFDPHNSGGAHYGQLLPLRRLRVTASHPTMDGYSPATHGMFSGFIESWTPKYTGGMGAVVEVRAVDGFKILAMQNLNTDYPEEDVGARINRVLDEVGWTVGASWVLDSASNGVLGTTTKLAPNGERLIDGGISQVMAQWLEGVSALQHLQEVAALEGGWFFFDEDGRAVFHNRHSNVRPPLYVNRNTWVNDLSAAGLWFGYPYPAYDTLEFEYGDDLIYNEVRVERDGGWEQVVGDVASQSAYWKRTLQLGSVPLVSDDDALQMANWLLGRYKEPLLRISRMGMGDHDNTISWYHALIMRPHEQARIVFAPPGGGAVIEQYVLVQGVQFRFDVESGKREAVFRLSPDDPNRYWILGNAAQGLLGQTTRLMW
jgi:hypothetical protein